MLCFFVFAVSVAACNFLKREYNVNKVINLIAPLGPAKDLHFFQCSQVCKCIGFNTLEGSVLRHHSESDNNHNDRFTLTSPAAQTIIKQVLKA